MPRKSNGHAKKTRQPMKLVGGKCVAPRCRQKNCGPRRSWLCMTHWDELIGGVGTKARLLQVMEKVADWRKRAVASL